MKPSMKVECINDEPRTPAILKNGSVYTIASVFHLHGEAWVTLVEVDAPDFMPGWLASRFRPVRETDISIFTKMLTGDEVT
jgi:hypothetical protein